MPNELSEGEAKLLPKLRPRGKAKRRTKAQLKAMTSPEALAALLEEAQTDWRENAPKDYKTLLDSKLEKP